jgi:hypothetical protein
MRLLRLLSNSKRFVVIASTFVKLIPAFTNLFGLLFVICFVYALIGVQAFGGKIYRNNPKLVHTCYADKTDFYLTMNYNNFASAMVTLFEMLIVSNISVLIEGLQALVGWWSPVYYLSFWIAAVCVVLNLLLAFILEAFVDNYAKLKRADDELPRKLLTASGAVVLVEQQKPTTVYDVILNSEREEREERDEM